MPVSTVNISFQEELLAQIDDQAKLEARSRSELIREAARLYIERKRRWQSIFDYGKAKGRALGLSESEVMTEIRAVRANRP